MKPPPDVSFHRAEQPMVWIPHGVMDAQRIEQLINALGHEEALAQTYFHRFSDFSFVDRVNLDFDYVLNAPLVRRLTHSQGPKIKSQNAALRRSGLDSASDSDEKQSGCEMS